MNFSWAREPKICISGYIIVTYNPRLIFPSLAKKYGNQSAILKDNYSWNMKSKTISLWVVFWKKFLKKYKTSFAYSIFEFFFFSIFTYFMNICWINANSMNNETQIIKADLQPIPTELIKKPISRIELTPPNPIIETQILR